MSQSVSVANLKTKNSFGSIIISILFGILFPLLIVEIAARLIPGLIPPEIRAVFQQEQQQELKGLISDEVLGYKYAPGLTNFLVPFEGDTAEETYHISTVSLGYNDIGFRDDGVESEPFAVAIGDSYVSCASVEMEQCWVELLERQTHHDVINLGVVGYSPQQELGMLTKYGLPLHPKLVLWVFFTNDINDAWRFDQFGSGGAKQGKLWQDPLKAWLARNSVVYTVGSFFWYNRHLFYNLAQADGNTVPHDSNLVWWLTNTDLNTPEVAEGLTLTQQAILEARRQTLAANPKAQFVLLILPFREQVYAPATVQLQLDRLNHTLNDFCRQHNLTCLDLTPALREQAKIEPSPIYYHKDIHLNVRGNKIVAKLLAEALQGYGLQDTPDVK